MDGSPTDRSGAAGRVARWANDPARKALWQARPVRGDVGILVVPESQIHCYFREQSTRNYSESITGAYQAFLFSNIQADFVYCRDSWEHYAVLYLPHPLMLPEATAASLAQWVAAGGTLVSEGCPAFFGDRGRALAKQPGHGLDEVFGVSQEYVELMPDLLDDLRFEVAGASVAGGVCLQTFGLEGGEAVGTYGDGRVAVVDHTYGRGRTRLIGTCPGYGYFNIQDEDTRKLFAEILPWAGRQPQVSCDDRRVVARVHQSQAAVCLWIVNSSRESVTAGLALADHWGPFQGCEVLWGEESPAVEGRTVEATVPPRDGLVLKLL
jgi:beta-galactosidase